MFLPSSTDKEKFQSGFPFPKKGESKKSKYMVLSMNTTCLAHFKTLTTLTLDGWDVMNIKIDAASPMRVDVFLEKED